MLSELQIYQLKTSSGLVLELLNFGARVRSLTIPVNNKNLNMVLGYDDIKDYLSDKFYVGASIGRFCNRIHGGAVSINNKKFKLPINEPEHQNTLHGGLSGFDKCIWERVSHSENHIEFKHFSPHLDQGFPGNLDVRAIYKVEKLGFSIEYTAVSDQDTLVNLCNHSYFNLNGFDQRLQSTITEHTLFVNSKNFLALNHNNVPKGDIHEVSNTPFDFSKNSDLRKNRSLKSSLESKHSQIQSTRGLDHTYVLGNSEERNLTHAAQLYSRISDIALDISTTQIGLHIYTGNYLQGHYLKHSGICFETQGFPNSPNEKNFPSAILRAGEKYSQISLYNFQKNYSERI